MPEGGICVTAKHVRCRLCGGETEAFLADAEVWPLADGFPLSRLLFGRINPMLENASCPGCSFILQAARP